MKTVVALLDRRLLPAPGRKLRRWNSSRRLVLTVKGATMRRTRSEDKLQRERTAFHRYHITTQGTGQDDMARGGGPPCCHFRRSPLPRGPVAPATAADRTRGPGAAVLPPSGVGGVLPHPHDEGGGQGQAAAPGQGHGGQVDHAAADEAASRLLRSASPSTPPPPGTSPSPSRSPGSYGASYSYSGNHSSTAASSSAPVKRYYGMRKTKGSDEDSNSEDEDMDTTDHNHVSSGQNYGTSGTRVGFGNSGTGRASGEGNTSVGSPSCSLQSKPSSTKPPGGKSSAQLTMRERMKRKMQLQLNRQYKMDKRAEQERKEKEAQELQERQEELRELSTRLKEKERARRRELGDASSRSTSRSRSMTPPARSRSPLDRSRSRSRSPVLRRDSGVARHSSRYSPPPRDSVDRRRPLDSPPPEDGYRGGARSCSRRGPVPVWEESGRDRNGGGRRYDEQRPSPWEREAPPPPLPPGRPRVWETDYYNAPPPSYDPSRPPPPMYDEDTSLYRRRSEKRGGAGGYGY
ncbi:unnamed protein product [Cyprideis torosa]|uniref:Uncharacterized protein n=1 Tax=Cyprideis torosa TaxID=163714 RepID=A0A7R8W4G5_9CRUS|nr:unnamed protein product [Cyprideis torosa]CAG0883119.1 unnamed protein product [Cyprideis torosa]